MDKKIPRPTVFAEYNHTGELDSAELCARRRQVSSRISHTLEKLGLCQLLDKIDKVEATEN